MTKQFYFYNSFNKFTDKIPWTFKFFNNNLDIRLECVLFQNLKYIKIKVTENHQPKNS